MVLFMLELRLLERNSNMGKPGSQRLPGLRPWAITIDPAGETLNVGLHARPLWRDGGALPGYGGAA